MINLNLTCDSCKIVRESCPRPPKSSPGYHTWRWTIILLFFFLGWGHEGILSLLKRQKKKKMFILDSAMCLACFLSFVMWIFIGPRTKQEKLYSLHFTNCQLISHLCSLIKFGDIELHFFYRKKNKNCYFCPTS
jgi:hypothetical protein